MKRENIESLYELTPLQQGMLFHTLYAPDSGVYAVQLNMTLEGELNRAAFVRAFQQVMERHPILRTAFYWQELEKPLQVVYRTVELPLQELDWRSLSAAEQERDLQAFFQQDRHLPFQFTEAPVMRLSLIRLGERTHRFVWTFHHLLLDGWSLQLVLQEVWQHYEAYRAGRELNLRPARPFRDYLAWLQGQDMARAESFWREALQGFSEPTPLPLDYGARTLAPGEQRYAVEEIALPAEVQAGLQRLARQHQVTLNTVFQGIWALYLGRASGEEEVVFGCTVSGRPAELQGVESMAGMFINTLPVRARVPLEAELGPWLQALQSAQLEARQFEHSPLSKVQEWSEVPRGLSLFETLFVFENFLDEEGAESGEPQSLKIIDGTSEEQTSFPLTLTGIPGRQLILRLMYETTRYELQTVRQMLDQLSVMLQAVASKGDQQLWEIPLLPRAEQQRVIEEWNRTEVEFPLDKQLLDYVEEQAKERSEALAIAAPHKRWSYGELNSFANRLARFLQAQGVGPERVVGVCLERSPEQVGAYLAIWKAGGAFLMIDPNYPPERIRFMIEDAGADVVLTAESLRDQVGGADCLTVCVDADAHLFEKESADDLLVRNQPDHLACVLYTSGSTGTPKGVELLHKSLLNFAHWYKNDAGLTADDRTTHLTGPGFDVTILDLFPSLITGCAIFQPEREVMLAPEQLKDWMVEQAVTKSFATTALTEALMQQRWPAETALQQLTTGGEALKIYPRPDLPFRVVNGYGPSEATVLTTIFEMPAQTSAALSMPPIGRPLANMRVYVLDERLQPLPIGMPGQLHAAGTGVGRGYLRRPDLTSEKFIESPFGRLYKTGDKARWLPDGNLQYLGRLDQQVKIRGFRIELGEIEAALLSHASIKQAAALANDGQIIAYVAGQGVPTPHELRLFLQGELPAFMLPAYFVCLDALPVTPNGKINRRGLPAPTREHAAGAEEIVSARTQVEAELVSIWKKVLRLEGVGVTDNFFSLGGHSLLATQVTGAILSALGVELPLRALFESPTIEELAKIIEGLQKTPSEQTTLQPVDRNERLPLSFAQERLWFLEQLNTESAAYNIPMALRLSGQLDVEALKRSFDQLMARHETLRTTFVVVNGQPEQVIADEREMPFEQIDLTDMPFESAELQAALAAVEEGNKPFDLTRDALVRTQLLKLAAEEHLLLLTMHHIISDGWSMGVLIDELSKLYGAFRSGAESPLPELPLQYADFASWQREWLQGEVLDSQLSYWKQKLQGAPSLLRLPTDRPRPAVQTFVGSTREIVLDKAITERLKACSQAEGTTLFMSLLAAFNVLMARYSGQDDISIGSPIAGRTRPETHGLIGFFVNTLVLRTDLSGHPSFFELLHRVREVTLAAYAHQDLPFERLVKELRPERDMSHPPLFQVMFALQNAPMDDLSLSGLTWSDFPLERGTAKFDITVSLQEENGGLIGFVEYNTDLFDGETIDQMMRHYQVLIERMVEAPDRPVFDLPLLLAEEQQVFASFQGQKVPFRDDLPATRLFEAQVVRTPDRVAVEHGSTALTYRELNERANRLAHRLRALGVGRDKLVGIAVERGIEMIVGLLGVLKAGGAYVPIDPAYPQERIAYMLEDAQIEVLLTLSELAPDLPQGNALLIRLDQELFEAERADDLLESASPSDLAYVIYTSGSTGRPKGVLVPHRGLVNFAQSLVAELTIGEGVRVLQFASFSFDASVIDIFPTLIAGGTVVMVNRGDLIPGPQLQALLRELRINQLFGTPSMLALLPCEDLPELTTVLAGGEVLPDAVFRRWQQAGRRFYNVYGPTETTVIVTSELCTGERAPTIGRPLPNVEIHLLDPQMQPVPIGVAGELHVGGVSLARGYLNRPELTAEKFVESSYGRLYKTGDLARWLPNGTIEYLGRIDQQVKVRGFRIELGEIEAILRQHPAVQEALVIARREETGDQQLVGYLVIDEQNPPSTSELRSYLTQALPEFMVPALYVMLDAFPLSVNGKVDRDALPAPDRSQSGGQETLLPRTPIEAAVAEVWQKVLRVPQVGVQDQFFELGGHSLLATQVMAHLATALSVELPLRTLFESPTVEGLAAAIEKKRREEGVSSVLPILPVPRDGVLPLSFAQERLWFFEQYHRHTSTYNMPFALRLNGRLNEPALRQAFDEIVSRHEVLRTAFLSVQGEARQEIASEGKMPFTVVDLSLMPEIAEIQAALEAVEEGEQPFDLTAGALLRAKLLRLSDEDHILLLTMHHIISDGWSMGVLVHELSTLYAAYANGESSPLVPLPIQYVDYANWQREWFQGEVLEAQVSYWKEQLRQAPFILRLPTDKPRPTVQTHNGALREVLVAKGLLPRLQELSQQAGTTLFMTLLAAFNVLLSRMTGQQDLIVGSPIAGRTRQETDGLIGFFVNTLALRTDLSGDPSFHELLTRVRETTLGAYAHQDLPFERLVREVQAERDLSYAPLFQVMFALQNAPREALELPGLTLTDFPVQKVTSMFDLTLSLYEVEDGLAGNLTYNTDLFEERTMEQLVERFSLLLEGLVAEPDRSVYAAPILTAEEKQLVLHKFQGPKVARPEGVSVHHLFEEQAMRTPDHPAVEFAGDHLTYRQLNERANRLAHRLQQIGVGAEKLVGVAVERGLEMIVGLLGVLKAGGAYVPIDPTYPKERIEFMLEDSQADVLLTQSWLADRLPHTAHQILLDRDELADAPSTNLTGAISSEQLAYSIFTSGSTGRPKGVMIRHRGLLNFVQAMIEKLGMDESDRVLQFPSFSFDASVIDIYPTLLTGGTVVMIRQDDLLPGPHLQRIMRDKRITTIHCTPSVLAILPSDDLPELKRVIAGGEMLSQEVVQHWEQAGRRFLNVYGPTEITVAVTFAECVGSEHPSIGQVLPNTEVYILDSLMQPVPIGVPGELHVGGVGVARGYLQRPDLTAEKFVDSEYGRVYKTGDLARWLPDGSVEYLGRVDSQVKIRGFRVELGEIESALRQHQQVIDAVVIAHQDETGDKRLVGYVATGGAEAPQIADLRHHLKSTLPEFMVPALFVILDEFPLTVNRKVDRSALPAPVFSSGDAEVVLPRTTLEDAVATVWRNVLRLDQVGVYDNFFELGGHSLLATQVMAHLTQLVRVELPLRDLFEAPTVEGLAARVGQKLREEGATHLVPITTAPRTERLPLSFAQERLWFFEQFQGASSTYNMPIALRLTGRLDAEALKRAFDEIVHRHEVLRTVFLTVDGEAEQQILQEAEMPFEKIDLTELSAVEREMQALLTAMEEGDRPFDLTREHLVRATLLKLAEEEHILLLTMHHIVSDGWSMGIFIEEWSTLYSAFAKAEPSPLPPLAIQYADYASWQRKWLQGEELARQLDYWREQLADAPFVLQLPTDRPRAAVQTYNGTLLEVELGDGLLPALKELSHSESATLFMTLLAAFSTMLARTSGQEDLVIGTPIAGRTRQETEAMIGFFVNTLALRTDLSGDPSFRELVARVRETTLGAYAHQDLPFERLVREVQPDRDMSYPALFQVMFALQNAPRGDLELPGLSLTSLPIEKGTSLFDLTFSFFEAGDGLRGHVQYNTDLFDEETVQRLVERLNVVLTEVVSDPDRSLSELSLLTERERSLLASWRATDAPYSADACLHQLFEAQVERTPDAIAVEHQGMTLTYRELDLRANRIANALQAKGVGPDRLVAIATERTPEMAIGVLAVLKAGGAYLPLDPTYPSDRLRYMLDDSQASWLLTTELLRPSLPVGDQDVLLLDGDWSAVSEEPVNGGATPDSLAYVIYTSGSTGQPKGTMLMHRGAVNFVEDHQRRFGWKQGDRVLKYISFSFDASACDLLVPLVTGATVCFAEHRLPGPELIDQLRAERITAICLSPAALAMLPPYELPLLRTIVAGGEAIGQELIERFASAHDLFIEYGPTEATVAVTSMQASAGDRSGLLGYPIQNARLYVLDERMQQVPIGVPGELYLAGISLARGYLNRPELTSEKFLQIGGERMYKTGDRVRWLPDGNLEFLGRIDDQVKLRGFRIELGEVEAVLRNHPLVRDATVLLREDLPGDPRLVGYVAGDAAQLGAEELREHLLAQLPAFMVPSAIVVLDALPITANGKIDRRALPAPAEQRAALAAEYVAPRDAIELSVSQIFADLLGLAQVGVNDNFFALGGHSLLAVRLTAQIRQQFGRELALSSLFQQATVAGIARALREDGQASDSPLVQLKKGEGTPIFFVHAIGGSALSYLELADAWDGEEPLYALQARGLEAGEAPIASIDQMAADYVQAIIAVQQEGAFRLAGWSFGGAVAYAMARQLQARGREVSTLLLIDSFAPTLMTEEGDALSAFAVDLAGQLGNVPLPEELAELDAADELEGLKSLDRHLSSGLGLERLNRLYSVFKANRAALACYQPDGVTDLATALFLSEKSALHPLAPTLGWDDLLPNVDVRQVAGDHFTMLRRGQVEALAKSMQEAFQVVSRNA
ncbi:non-ribosomal peptide synthetase [Tumebacillus lipolyticus]|uniref:Amino acid adenylation domain-containing protein n=1 Tax=Tumebacillus lipolyticus TaxID=1280370 RepID=A0ABW4ZU57_9BACL